MTQDLENLVNRSYTSEPKYTEIMTGVPEDYKQIRTLGDLLEVNYKIITAKEQLRQNLISKIRSNKTKYPGIIGFDDDVIPALDRAILSCHVIILVGQIDAIKITKKGTEMYEIESYSPGQLMQAKHGLFCIDELPVLDTRKQVALLSVLQEGRFTTGAYPVIFEPKTAFIATANPIDYTHSGKIIEPLYDRLKSHIHTHYPRSIKDEMLIITQEAKVPKSFIPIFMLKILARIVQNARKSQEINQDKGVSVRMGVHSLELLVGEAERIRAISHNIQAVPRPCDIFCISQCVKFELAELDDTAENREKTLKNLIASSMKDTCLEYLNDIDPNLIETIKKEFGGQTFHVSQGIVGSNSTQTSYDNQLKDFNSLSSLVNETAQKAISEQDEFIKAAQKYNIPSGSIIISEKTQSELRAATTELVLEGLFWMEPKILDKKEGGYAAV